MRDAFGGLVNIVIIVVFLVLVSGLLAFNVNYTKAYRVKNKIITTLEQSEGVCSEDSACDNAIVDYMRTLGYSANNFNLDGFDCKHGYCIKEISTASETGAVDEGNGNKVYFQVYTQINIDIPILNKILPGLRIFQVGGTTQIIIKQ